MLAPGEYLLKPDSETPPPPAPTPLPLAQAVLNAANAVLSGAPVAPGQRQVVVIDPLVNGVTGEQSLATQQIQDQIVALAQQRYPQFDIQAFSVAAVSKGPDVIVGTFTPVNAQGQTAGTREGYRFCLVMVDLHAGKLLPSEGGGGELDVRSVQGGTLRLRSQTRSGARGRERAPRGEIRQSARSEVPWRAHARPRAR